MTKPFFISFYKHDKKYSHYTYCHWNNFSGILQTIGSFNGILDPKGEFRINNTIFNATLRPIAVEQGRSANNIILTDDQFDFSMPTHKYIELLSSNKGIDNIGSLKGNWTFTKKGANTQLVYLG